MPGGRLGWLHPLNAFDLARAYGGVSLIIAAFASIHPAGPQQMTARVVLFISAAAGLLIQHGLHRTGEDTMHAPVAYLAGLTLAILPIEVSLLALPIGVITAIGLRHVSWCFLMTAASAGFFGLLLKQNRPTLVICCLLLLLPVLLSRLVHRPMVIAVRPDLIKTKVADYGRLR